jgi:hypothetical protein
MSNCGIGVRVGVVGGGVVNVSDSVGVVSVSVSVPKNVRSSVFVSSFVSIFHFHTT